MRSPQQQRDAPSADDRRAGSRRITIAVAAALVVLTLAGVAIARTKHDADVVDAELQRASRSLDEERVSLAQAVERRREAEAVLGRVLTRLAHERSDRTDVRSFYEVLRAELKDKLDELEATSGNLELRARQLDQLNQCLTGVAAAMRLAAYDADLRVIETLETVADVCESARGLTAKAAP